MNFDIGYFCWHKCQYKWGNREEGGCNIPDNVTAPCTLISKTIKEWRRNIISEKECEKTIAKIVEENKHDENYIDEYLADQWEMMTYCEEETNPHKDYEFEHTHEDNWIPF